MDGIAGAVARRVRGASECRLSAVARVMIAWWSARTGLVRCVKGRAVGHRVKGRTGRDRHPPWLARQVKITWQTIKITCRRTADLAAGLGIGQCPVSLKQVAFSTNQVVWASVSQRTWSRD